MAFVSNNITLTGLTQADEADIVSCMQDKEISDSTGRIPYPYTIEHAKLWIEDNLIFEEENGFKRNYAIRNEAGKMIGCIGLHFNYGYESDKSEFGYWLGKPYWNRGIMTEAIKLFATLVLQRYKVNTLEAHVFDFNEASQKVLVKAGFTKYEFIQDYYEKDGKKISAIKFALTLV